MTEFHIKLKCPQDGEDCVGRGKCKKDRSKGCAQDNFDVMRIESADRWACV